MKWAVALGLALVIVLASFFILRETAIAPTVVHESEVSKGAPLFSWTYRDYVENDIPRSEISLVATYGDGTRTTKVIDTVEGSCTPYESTEEQVYEHASMILCYYAGFGLYYKVVEKSGSHLVQRKEFEEASPDYDPPVQPYETIATF